MSTIYPNAALYRCDGCQTRIESLYGGAHLICVACNFEMRLENAADWLTEEETQQFMDRLERMTSGQ